MCMQIHIHFYMHVLIDSFNTLKYEQGTRRKILTPQKDVWNDFPRGNLGINMDQWIAFRPLAASFGRLLESYLPNSMIVEPLHFEAFRWPKRDQTLHPSKNHNLTGWISELSACFLCSHANPLFLFQTHQWRILFSSQWFSGNFRWFSFGQFGPTLFVFRKQLQETRSHLRCWS